jgi:hypothetical protein
MYQTAVKDHGITDLGPEFADKVEAQKWADARNDHAASLGYDNIPLWYVRKKRATGGKK